MATGKEERKTFKTAYRLREGFSFVASWRILNNFPVVVADAEPGMDDYR